MGKISPKINQLIISDLIYGTIKMLFYSWFSIDFIEVLVNTTNSGQLTSLVEKPDPKGSASTCVGEQKQNYLLTNTTR